jgi:hypothetical protein
MGQTASAFDASIKGNDGHGVFGDAASPKTLTSEEFDRRIREIEVELTRLKLHGRPPVDARKEGEGKIFSAEWWRYFLIGFAGPPSDLEAICELKPLEPGEALQLAWDSTSKRMAKWKREIQYER